MGLPSAVGVNTNFVAPFQITLVIEERRGASDRAKTLDVKDIRGNVVLQCKGSVHGDEKCKKFAGPAHDLLFTLRKSSLPMPRVWYLVSPMNDRFVDISKRWTLGKAGLEVQFKNILAGGFQTLFKVHGDLAMRHADIMWDGRPVARIRKEFYHGRELFYNEKNYGIEIEAGADIALVAAIVLSLDEYSTKVG